MSSQGTAMENQFDLSHIVGHVVSAVALIGSFAGLLPALAGLVALVWYAIQIYESSTVQLWIRTRRARKIAHYIKRIHELEAQSKVALAKTDIAVIEKSTNTLKEALVQTTAQAAVSKEPVPPVV